MDVKQILHYSAIQKVGEGLNGVVYKAWDNRQHRTVAIKLLKDRPNRANLAERLAIVESLIPLDHPNVCPVHAVDETDCGSFIVMEFIDGVTLQEVVIGNQTEEYDFLEIGIQITRGLKAIHDKLIIHGNLKPSNIMIDEGGVVRLLDAGLSVLKDYQENPEYILPYEPLHYLSPEQITNAAVDFRSDLFSLGIILYRMVAGVLPFTGQNEDDLTQSIVNNTPDFERIKACRIEGDCVLLIEKLLAKSPHDRFTGTEELLVTLEEMACFEKRVPGLRIGSGRVGKPRQYLMISLLAVLMMLLWYVVSTYR